MMRKNNKRRKKIMRISVFFILILAISSLFAKNLIALGTEDEEVKHNIVILKNLENKDVASIENKINEKRDISDKKNDEKNNNENNKDNSSITKLNNKLYFENSVFMGDSQTEPLEVYDILNKSSVLAKKGQDVIKARESASQLKNLNPQRVFLLYGLNDLLLFENASDFKVNYIKLVQEIKKNAPNAEMYIESTMPIQPKAQQKNKKFSQDRIDEFLQVEKEVANEENINFIDIRNLVKGRDDLYEPDGMHLNVKFYGNLLDYLKK